MIWINRKLIKFDLFPNNETYVDGESIDNAVNSLDNLVITFKYETDMDLIRLMLVKRHLEYYGYDVALKVLYMPYSRMDRKGTPKTVFTLKYVSELINSLNFKWVSIIEPHSDVTCALLDRAYPDYVTLGLLDQVVSKTEFDKERDFLFFPDAGAQKRYGSLKGYKTLVGYKHRDFETGKIESLKVVGDIGKNEVGFKVIVLDDLCSYGGTFIRSANELIKLGAEKTYLFVAHCENSIFKGELLTKHYYDKIFTTNSIISDNGGKHQIHIFDIIGGEL